MHSATPSPLNPFKHKQTKKIIDYTTTKNLQKCTDKNIVPEYLYKSLFRDKFRAVSTRRYLNYYYLPTKNSTTKYLDTLRIRCPHNRKCIHSVVLAHHNDPNPCRKSRCGCIVVRRSFCKARILNASFLKIVNNNM